MDPIRSINRIAADPVATRALAPYQWPVLTLARLPIVAAILMSALACRRSASWGPILIALTLSLGNDLIGEHMHLPPRADLALWLLAPAISSWCARVVLARARWLDAAVACGSAWAIVWFFVLLAPWPDLWWGPVRIFSLVLSLGAQATAIGRWLERGELGGTAEAAAVGLFGGDLFLLIGSLLPGPWWTTAGQASFIACLIVAYQIRCEILSSRR